MRVHSIFLFNFSSPKFSVLTNNLIYLWNGNKLLTANFEHWGSFTLAKHWSLYSVMAFANISTSSKDASWTYWANAMMVLQQNTECTMITCRISMCVQQTQRNIHLLTNLKKLSKCEAANCPTSWQFNYLIWILWLILYLVFIWFLFN